MGKKKPVVIHTTEGPVLKDLGIRGAANFIVNPPPMSPGGGDQEHDQRQEPSSVVPRPPESPSEALAEYERIKIEVEVLASRRDELEEQFLEAVEDHATAVQVLAFARRQVKHAVDADREAAR